MRNRSARIALAGLVLLVQAGAAWKLWSLERERTAALNAARALDGKVRGLVSELADLRAAQQAYVADGQSQDVWFGKATAALDSLRAGLSNTRTLAAGSPADQAIQSTTELLAAFEKTDQQARGLITSEQRLTASDLIFGDGASTISALAARLDEAQARVAEDVDRRLGRIRTVEIAAIAAAAAVTLAGVVLLLPLGLAAPQPDTGGADAVMAIAPAAAPPPPAAVPPAPPAPDLGGIAKLCVEFGRVGDPAVLPQLVERAASLLNASGLIVWMINPKVGALHPVLSYGYSELALARIGELASDEDNATAEAFRTGEARIVEGGGGAHGAIAVPIITPTGCVGVLAAEIRDRGERNLATQAIAAIVAAQLASLSSASQAAS